MSGHGTRTAEPSRAGIHHANNTPTTCRFHNQPNVQLHPSPVWARERAACLPGVVETVIIKGNCVVPVLGGRQHARRHLVFECARILEVERHKHMRAAFACKALPRRRLPVAGVEHKLRLVRFPPRQPRRLSRAARFGRGVGWGYRVSVERDVGREHHIWVRGLPPRADVLRRCPPNVIDRVGLGPCVKRRPA